MEKYPIKPPIIIDESGDLEIFATIEAAESYLEPIDVNDERYVGYDSEGRLLRLSPTEPRITIEGAEAEPMHSQRLHFVLTEYLRRVLTPTDWIEQATLGELIAKASEFGVQSITPLEQIRSFLRRLLRPHSQ